MCEHERDVFLLAFAWRSEGMQKSIWRCSMMVQFFVFGLFVRGSAK